MKSQTTYRSSARRLLHWSINILWMLGWIVLLFVCLNVLGNTLALFGTPLLIIGLTLIWYFTDRRDAHKLSAEEP